VIVPSPAPGSGTVERHAERLHEALKTSFKDLFARLGGARIEERTGYLLLVCPLLPLPQLNGVWAQGPKDEQAAVHELEGAIAEIEQLGLRCWVQTRAGRTPSLEAEARRLGFTSQESVPALLATPDDLHDIAGAGLKIARIADTAGLAQAQAVATAGFEAPLALFCPFYTPQVAATPGLSIYVALADGTPVSTAIGFTQGEAVGIFNVATPPKHRRRGYGTAVTARAVSDGFKSGASFGWLQSSPLGESIYQRMGFQQVETYTLLSRPQGGPGL